MAKRSPRVGGCQLGLVALAGVVMVGCAARPEDRQRSPQPALMVDALPLPNFDGPDLAEPPPAPPVAVAPIPPAGLEMGSIPRNWSPTARAVAWRWIVIHHSATPTGGAAAFDKEHRAKGWDELGYHFVIGNGTDTLDGLVEVGGRWSRQKWGAHAKTPDNRFNEFGIGICLVGNFDLARPSDEQVRSLSKLVAFLMRTYRIPPDRVVGHGDTGRATDCPGRLMNVAQIRRLSAQVLVDAGQVVPAEAGDARTASLELLGNTPHQ